MTNDVTQNSPMQAWWENVDLQTKEYCSLKEDGELVLKTTPHYSERVIASLTIENAEAALNALKEKFPEVEAKVTELDQEWKEADDRLKLIGKVARLKDYLLHTNAIGNFEALFQSITGWEKEIDELTEQNYKARAALVMQAEELAMHSETWKETSLVFKEIGDQWKSIGFVDKTRNDELWNRLEQARDKFFERKRQYQEEHEKELLQNLDLKMELVEKAEQTAATDHWKENTEIFRQLMDQWKSIGRTVHDKNEELWNRFILAKNSFYERKRIHFEQIQAEQEANYALKLALVEQAEEMKESTDWNKTSQAYAALMDEWKKIGRVPAERSDELWDRLNAAKDHFFNGKRQHFETVRVSQEDNYAQKLALLKRAEALKTSSQWRETTAEMNELLDEWKKIGPVPREHINTLWEQFIAARKFFFDRKDADREKRKKHAEKQTQYKLDQSRSFLHKLEQELKEEEERVVDFKEALQNITPGNKAEELRNHLTKLIQQSETRLIQKAEKIKTVMQELEEIEKKNAAAVSESATKNKSEDTTASE